MASKASRAAILPIYPVVSELILNCDRCCALIKRGTSNGKDIIAIRANPPPPFDAMENETVSKEEIPHTENNKVAIKRGKLTTG